MQENDRFAGANLHIDLQILAPISRLFMYGKDMRLKHKRISRLYDWFFPHRLDFVLIGVSQSIEANRIILYIDRF